MSEIQLYSGVFFLLYSPDGCTSHSVHSWFTTIALLAPEAQFLPRSEPPQATDLSTHTEYLCCIYVVDLSPFTRTSI